MTWLSEIEAWEEKEKDEDIRRMARVIRELAKVAKAVERSPGGNAHVNMEALFDAWHNLSPDAKELLDG